MNHLEWKARGWSFIMVFGFLIGCTSVKLAPEPIPLKTFSSDAFVQEDEMPKCKHLLDSYCKFLYAPDVMGNIQVKRAQSSTQILQGETVNGFSQVFYRYAEAKLRYQARLPKDFNAILRRYDYFNKMREFLNRKPRETMSVSQRLHSEKLDYDLGSIWAMAVNETVLNRMMQKFPGFHKVPDKLIPLELVLEQRRLRRVLISELSNALWRDDKNWKDVEHAFVRLQDGYSRLISKLDIPKSLQESWQQKIREIKLVVPGAIPAISDEECSSTTINAYYFTNLNMLTICAGDFNSEDIMQTLAHEMGHALGIDRTQYLFQIESDFGRNLSRLRQQLCQPETFSCEEWEKYKSKFDARLTSLDGFRPDLPEVQRCLKRRQTAKPLVEDDIHRFARNIVTDRISDLASSDRFLRITKPTIPMRNGLEQQNPNYLNPCSYYLWSQGEEPVDSELTTLLFFTAEYRCSAEPAPQKMKNAIEIAKALSIKVVEKSLAIEGEFSARSLLETEGFSSAPYERFADLIGGYAMAELLEELPNEWDRRNKFLASSSWQCLEPSLASHFPNESAVEKEYVFDAHAEGDQRRKELFSTPIRKAIGCEKDFEFQECHLPFNENNQRHL